MNIESLQRMQNLSQVLEAARRRNGIGVGQAPLAPAPKAPNAVRNEAASFRSAYAASANPASRPTPNLEPSRTIKTLGRHVDVMA